MISMTISPSEAAEKVLSLEEMEGIRGGTVAQIPGADTSLPVVLPGGAAAAEDIRKAVLGAATYVLGQAVWSNREAIVSAASHIVAEAGDAFITFGRDVSGGCQVMWDYAKRYF